MFSVYIVGKREDEENVVNEVNLFVANLTYVTVT